MKDDSASNIIRYLTFVKSKGFYYYQCAIHLAQNDEANQSKTSATHIERWDSRKTNFHLVSMIKQTI